MSVVLQLDTTILPGHRIEIQAPELPVGRTATVTIVVSETETPKRPLDEVLGDYRGGKLFQSAAEVDDYLREERDCWKVSAKDGSVVSEEGE